MLASLFGSYSKMALAILAAIMLSAATGYITQRDARIALDAEKALLNKELERMSREHFAAIEAAEDARRARDEIYAMQTAKSLSLEKALGACADFAALPIPDSVRETHREACARDYAASKPDGSDPAAQP